MAPSTSEVQTDRDGERSGRQSINSLSSPSTDEAFESDRPLIHGDSSVSMAATISQSHAAQGSRRRWPLMLGLSGLGLALLIGIAILITNKNTNPSASRAASAQWH